MGLLAWWRDRREAQRARDQDLALNTDQGVIGDQVPELLGMDVVEGMAYLIRQMDLWNETATPERAAELAGRLIASQESFRSEGRIMPYWGNLWVLRTYQRELGIPAPDVAPARTGNG
jgi:hypothetical protein